MSRPRRPFPDTPALAIAAVTMFGCGAGPSLDRYAGEEPAREALVGVWRPYPSSLIDLRRQARFKMVQPSQHELELHESGTCRFRTHRQYSYVNAEDPEASSYFATADCAWSLGKTPVRVGTEMLEVPAVLMRVRDGEREAQPFYFPVMRGGRLILWQTIGEPDSGYYMEFAKAG